LSRRQATAKYPEIAAAIGRVQQELPQAGNSAFMQAMYEECETRVMVVSCCVVAGADHGRFDRSGPSLAKFTDGRPGLHVFWAGLKGHMLRAAGNTYLNHRIVKGHARYLLASEMDGWWYVELDLRHNSDLEKTVAQLFRRMSDGPYGMYCERDSYDGAFMYIMETCSPNSPPRSLVALNPIAKFLVCAEPGGPEDEQLILASNVFYAVWSDLVGLVRQPCDLPR
jgi:hypothetical protein